MVQTIVPQRRDAATLAYVLEMDEIDRLIAEIDSSYISGRRGYGTRRLVAVLFCKYLYVQPTWTATVQIVSDNPRLKEVCRCTDELGVPTVDAMYRFLRKLRRHPEWLDALTVNLQASIRAIRPSYGSRVAGDGSDLPAFANGQRYVKKNGPERKKFSDPDATWGHRGSVATRKGGGFYGYKPHALVCTDLDLPVAWVTRTAKAAEIKQVEKLLDDSFVREHKIELCIFDKGYDVGPIYDLCHGRRLRVVIPLHDSDEERDAHAVPECRHGRQRRYRRWIYAGTDMKRSATKWRCPDGKCKPGSVWIPLDRFHPSIPRATARSKKTYKLRGAVERFWSRLKEEWGLLELRVRRIDRVSQHVDLTVLAYLSFNLAKLRLL